MDLYEVYKQFPVLQKTIGCNKLIYLDNAATTQKPLSVINALADYYKKSNANVYRSGHFLARKAQKEFDKARRLFLEFVNGTNVGQVVFTKNATEAINAVIMGIVYKKLFRGEDLADKVVVTTYAEHNSNLLPYLRLQKLGVKIKIVGLQQDGAIDYKELEEFIAECRKEILLVGVNHVSNVTGNITDIERIAELMRKSHVVWLLDAAQSIAHLPIDVKKLGLDYLVFSGHKMYAPMGIGGVYIKADRLEDLDSYIIGGGTVDRVTDSKMVYKSGSEFLIGGTPNVGGAVGLAEAISFINNIGRAFLQNHFKDLIERSLDHVEKLISKWKGTLHYIGAQDSKRKSGVFSFYIRGFTELDPVRYFDEEGIAVRGGKHCAHLLHQYLKIPYTLRASYAVYNTPSDIDTFFEVLDAYLSVIKD